MNAVTFNYNGQAITFRKGDSVMVNATEMANYSERGYFSTRTHRFFHSDGRPDCSVMTVVTQKGRAFLNAHFNNN